MRKMKKKLEDHPISCLFISQITFHVESTGGILRNFSVRQSSIVDMFRLELIGMTIETLRDVIPTENGN